MVQQVKQSYKVHTLLFDYRMYKKSRAKIKFTHSEFHKTHSHLVDIHERQRLLLYETLFVMNCFYI
jgi:hypothetical protein